MNKFICIALVLCLNSCLSREYEYRIQGQIETKRGKVTAMFYADSFDIGTDSVITIMNSNGTVLRVEPPFDIVRIQD